MQEDHRGFIRLKNFGGLNGPDGYGKAVNHCGETMEIFLRIRRGRVQDALFFSDGCLHTLQAGVAVTGLAQGKSVRDCLAISEDMIRKNAANLPADHGHCVRQARSALKKALRDYAVRSRSEILTEKSTIGRIS